VSLVQDLRGRKKIKSQLVEYLSSIPGIKILSCKIHGLVYRKKLVNVGAFNLFLDFPLLRVKWEYKKGHGTFVKTSIIYPADVYPHGRQILVVVEEVARLRYREGCSWYKLERRLSERYDFSLNRIKRMLKRVSLVFNRLITSRIIPFFCDVSAWIMEECRRFVDLSFTFRERMVGGIFQDGSFINVKDLIRTLQLCGLMLN